MSVNHSASSGGIIGISLRFSSHECMLCDVVCTHLESPHRGDSNKYTQYTILNTKKKISSYGIFSKGPKHEFERAISVQATEVLRFFDFKSQSKAPGHVAQSVGHLSQRSWVRYPVWPHTFVSPAADSRRALVSYWRKYVHEVLVNGLGGLSLPRKNVVRLTDRPAMTLDVKRGRKTTTQQTSEQDMS